MSPLVANAVGFLLSFGWCFFGHARWTFPAERRDVGVACITALGLVPLETIEARASSDETPAPEASRLAQLDFVLGILSDARRDRIVRAQARRSESQAA